MSETSESRGDTAEQTSTPASPAPTGQEKSKASKVEILLHPTGDTPIIKKKKWTLEPTKQVAFISDFVKKLIKCDPKDSLFLYVNQSFAPSPDTEVGSLYECFGSDGKLVLHYCKTQAWG